MADGMTCQGANGQGSSYAQDYSSVCNSGLLPEDDCAGYSPSVATCSYSNNCGSSSVFEPNKNEPDDPVVLLTGGASGGDTSSGNNHCTVSPGVSPCAPPAPEYVEGYDGKWVTYQANLHIPGHLGIPPLTPLVAYVFRYRAGYTILNNSGALTMIINENWVYPGTQPDINTFVSTNNQTSTDYSISQGDLGSINGPLSGEGDRSKTFNINSVPDEIYIIISLKTPSIEGEQLWRYGYLK